MSQLDDLLWELAALEKDCPGCAGQGSYPETVGNNDEGGGSHEECLSRCDNCGGTGKVPMFEGVREPCPESVLGKTYERDYGPHTWCKTCKGKHYVPSRDVAPWLVAARKAIEDMLIQGACWDMGKRRYTAFLVEVSTGETFINGDVSPDPLLALLTAIKAAVKHD